MATIPVGKNNEIVISANITPISGLGCHCTAWANARATIASFKNTTTIKKDLISAGILKNVKLWDEIGSSCLYYEAAVGKEFAELIKKKCLDDIVPYVSGAVMNIFSDNLNVPSMFKTRDVVKSLIKDHGWAGWASPLVSNPNHRNMFPTFCQAWVLIRPSDSSWVIPGSDWACIPEETFKLRGKDATIAELVKRGARYFNLNFKTGKQEYKQVTKEDVEYGFDLFDDLVSKEEEKVPEGAEVAKAAAAGGGGWR